METATKVTISATQASYRGAREGGGEERIASTCEGYEHISSGGVSWESVVARIAGSERRRTMVTALKVDREAARPRK